MNPVKGNNPHGLETRNITYHAIFDNVEVLTQTVKDKLFCYATIPDSLQQGTSTEWTIKDCSDSVSYASAVKYVSKEQSGTRFMIQGDQDMYYKEWTDEKEGIYGIVGIIDISGSMTDNTDFTRVNSALTCTFSHFQCNAVKPQIYMYSGTYINNVSDKSLLTNTTITQSTDLEIYNKFKSLYSKSMCNDGSEAMISMLYYAIGDYITKYRKNKLTDSSCPDSITFLILTDETLFKKDSTQNYSNLVGSSPYHQWFKTWQSKANNKFPTTMFHNSNSDMTTQEKISKNKELIAALKQMSKYYGINFNFSVAYPLLYLGNANDVVACAQTIPVVSPWQYTSSGFKCTYSGVSFGGKVNNTNYYASVCWYDQITKGDTGDMCDKEWMMPVDSNGNFNYHVVNPYEPMCTIAFCGVDFKTNYILTEDDQYDSTALSTKLHKVTYTVGNKTYTKYCKFEYFSHNEYSATGMAINIDTSFSLPTLDMTTSSKSSIKWKLRTTAGTIYNGGSTYKPVESDCLNNHTVYFDAILA